MGFREMMQRAKRGDQDAQTELLQMYKPLLLKCSMINGRLDEDLFQEQCITLLHCIELFEI